MSDNTKIEWADATFNPWWGCLRVSDGCTNCYAETFAKRTGHAIWGPSKTTGRRLFGDQHWAEPLKWNRAAEAAGERKRVFCASMADVFEDHPDVWESRQRLWDLIAETPALDWLLLTKRPENVMQMVPMDWTEHGFPTNVWLGTSTEDQRTADERIPHLLATPAAVRFLSCEPLLGHIDILPWVTTFCDRDEGQCDWLNHRRRCEGCALEPENLPLHWVIAGGESGPRFRAMDLDWARSLRDQCVAAGVAFHFKQVGGRTPKAGGRLLDGRTWDEFPTPKGGSVERSTGLHAPERRDVGDGRRDRRARAVPAGGVPKRNAPVATERT